VLWGANPTVSAPLWARTVASTIRPGRNLIVIDPMRTDLAERARIHLQIRPGTDGALALGLMHVIVREGLFDRAYVERYTVGFKPLRELIERYDPLRVARITSIRETQIRRAARLIAQQGPTSIWQGLGLEHHENATQTVRAVTTLQALCGHIDAPGGDQLLTERHRRVAGAPLPCLQQLATPDPVPPPVEARPIGYDEYPIYDMFNRTAQANLFARAILEDRPYPLRALILIGANPLLTAPDSTRMRRACDKLSLLVSIDPFLSASGQVADYVLPAATFAEGPPSSGNSVVAAPVVREQHESRTDWKILTGLAAALGLERYFPWPTLEEAMAAPHFAYTFDAKRTLFAEESETNRPRFPTTTGRIELYSRPLESFGYAPLPEWKEPTKRSGGDEDDYPYILVTGSRTRAYINSQFREIPSVSGKMLRPLALVHPDIAKKVGIVSGDLMAVVSPHGRIVLHVEVTSRVHPECVIVPSGWSSASANNLTHADSLDPITGFPPFRSGTCRLEALTATS
jgi:anaerobic selenocysteine-containing dehydrogenase